LLPDIADTCQNMPEAARYCRMLPVLAGCCHSTHLLLGASILGHFLRDEGLSGMWQPIFIGKACSTISDPINTSFGNIR
jgi:hypothetical protein